jgi:hypothetical protein
MKMEVQLKNTDHFFQFVHKYMLHVFMLSILCFLIDFFPHFCQINEIYIYVPSFKFNVLC